MTEIRFTAAVERDLIRIGDHIARDNPAAASRFIGAIRHHCYLLTTTPLMG